MTEQRVKEIIAILDNGNPPKSEEGLAMLFEIYHLYKELNPRGEDFTCKWCNRNFYFMWIRRYAKRVY